MGKISKNARKTTGSEQLISRWGGIIKMHTIFKRGKIKHYAECEKTGKQARKPKELM